MAEVSNEISVAFGALKTKTTGGIYRLDEEQYLVFTDIELPESFRADFGLSETGDTISMVGAENRVLIPDELLVNAGKLHCWVWLDTGEYGGKTAYQAIIPIKQRGNITDIQPTPAEKSTIDSLIDALNEGVDRAEDAADLLESASAEAETLAPGSEATAHYESGVFSFGIPAGLDGEKGDKGDKGETGATGAQGPKGDAGDDGVSPEVSIASIQGGHSVTITDADHPSGQSFNVLDGVDGADGDDGVSPTVAISSVTGGHSVTITDAQHPSGQSFNVLDGVDGDDGDDGVSPTVTVTTITGGHAVTITDASHPTGQTFNVMDGQDAVIDATLTHQGEAADAKATGDAVSELRNTLNHKADIIYDTASGDIASFPDGAEGLPVKDLTVGIEPVQSGSGDPSPDNVRPISGWTGANVTRTGANVWDEEWEIGTINTATGGNSSGSSRWRSKNLIPIRPDMDYCYRWGADGNYKTTGRVCYYDANGDYLSGNASFPGGGASFTNPAVFHTPANAYYMRFSPAGGTTYENDTAINYPAADHDYHPYTGNTYPITFPASAGTVYGGTLELPSCVLTVTDANIASYNGETLPGEWISDRDVYAAGTTPTTGAQVVYKLAAPQTYQLTPLEVITTILGQNNIWADCGPVSVEYPADTKLYIQKINTPTDDDMIADAQIASGKYFIVNNNLYLSTTNILAGDPIKPGTNCTLTNLAAALNAINS